MESLQHIAELLAVQLQRSVAIDNLQGDLLAHTAHDEPVDEYRVESIMRRRTRQGQTVTQYAMQFGISTATGPVHVPASKELQSLARVCVPIRCQNVLLGFLWLMDSEPKLGDDELSQAAKAADAAGEAMFRERLMDDLRRGRERELLRDLLNPVEAVRQHAVHLLVAEALVPDQARAVVVVVSIAAGEPTASTLAVDLALDRLQRRIEPTRSLAMSTSAAQATLLVAGRSLPERKQLAELAADLRAAILREAPPSTDVHIGVGPVVAALAAAHESYGRAVQATQVAHAVPSFGPIAHWDELGVYRLLVNLPLEQLHADVMPAGLARLLDDPRNEPLVHTLEVFLDHACNPSAAAELLNIHRTSLYYRIGRIQDITGMSLRDGTDRLSLHLGVKLARLSGLLPTAHR